MTNSPVEMTVYGGTVLTMDPQLSIIPHGVIRIANGKILSIDSDEKYLPTKENHSLDARGKLVMPGLINGHTHAGMSLLRGIADDLPLDSWLRKHIFPLERKLGSREFVRLGSQLACWEMLLSGTTLFNDMYYFEESTAEVAQEMGIRAICGQTHVEISGVEKSESVFHKFDLFFEEIKKYPLVQGALAPHSIYGLSEQLWMKLIHYAEKNHLMIHTHLSETKEETEKTIREKKMRPVEWFESIGLWNQKVHCAHAIDLNENDISLLGKYGVGISYNPKSNLKLGNGICPAIELREAGCQLSFGTDSTASNNSLDLLSEAGLGARCQALQSSPGKFTATDSVKLLTIEAAKSLGMDSKLGSLEPGKYADLIVLKLEEPHTLPLYDWYSHLIYSAKSTDICTTMINGKVIMKDRKLTSSHEQSIRQKVLEWKDEIARIDYSLRSSENN